ncbi:MAG TPA: hypothetical protein VEG63_02495 [Candidatus Acidoferrales bacterium]|nr:hypothetical protein [Candidatus Acidoferrales bacterium]
MTDRQPARCRMEGCNQEVPFALREDGFCLDHFVDGTYGRARRAVEAAQKELPLEPSAYEWMFEDAKMALKALVRDSNEDFREGAMELITALANVHEYLHQLVIEPAKAQTRAMDIAVGEFASRRAASGRNA